MPILLRRRFDEVLVGRRHGVDNCVVLIASSLSFGPLLSRRAGGQVGGFGGLGTANLKLRRSAVRRAEIMTHNLLALASLLACWQTQLKHSVHGHGICTVWVR